MKVRFLAALLFLWMGPVQAEEAKKPRPFYDVPGSIEDYEASAGYDQYHIIQGLLAGTLKSNQRQEMIDRFFPLYHPLAQQRLYVGGFSEAVGAGNLSNADVIVAEATKVDRSNLANLFCGLVADIDKIAESMIYEKAEVRATFETSFLVAQKYRMLNQSCGTHGTLRDVYARHFPDLEKKFATSFPQVRTAVTDAKQAKRWNCKESDLFYELSRSFEIVQRYRSATSRKIGIQEGTCRLYGLLAKSKSGEIVFRTDENEMGFLFEVTKLTSTSKVDVILDAMKKANLLTP